MSDVALVRGQWATKSELINYQFEEFNPTVIGTFGESYNGELPYRSLPSIHSLPGPLEIVGRGLAGLVYGADSYLYGLVDELSDFDIIHTAETYHGFSDQAITAKCRYDIPVVCTVWENIPFFTETGHYSRGPVQKVVRYGSNRIKNRVREHTDAFLAVTEQVKFALELEGVPSDRIFHVPMGVDTEQFRPGVASESSLDPDDFDFSGGDICNVVYLGRYTWSKGIYDLVSAWKEVTKQVDTPIHLTFVGPGDERGQLQKFIQEANVPNCTCGGPIPHESVPALLDMADVLVLPSVPTKYWQEQYGRVLLEAQATETAIVATKTGGIPEASGGIGEYVNPGDVQDIARGLTHVLKNKKYRHELAEAGRRRVTESYTIHDTATTVEQIYKTVLE